MSSSFPYRRAAARFLARTATLGSAAMLAVTVCSMAFPGVPGAAEATYAGDAQVIVPLDGSPGAGQLLSSGGSGTAFSLRLPAGSACEGDSANDGYRVQTFMVPASVDPATLQFDIAGPIPNGTGAAFRQPLYDGSGNAYVDQQTANASPTPGPGPIINIPAFSYGVYATGDIPAGTYNIGIACTLGPASVTQLDRFWNVEVTFVTDAGDQPAGVTWAVGDPSTTTSSSSSTSTPSTSSTTSTSTTSSTTTTTTAPTTTTTTTAPTTTTTAPTTTTTTTAPTTTTTAPRTGTTTSSTTTSSTTTTTTFAPTSTTSTTASVAPAASTPGPSVLGASVARGSSGSAPESVAELPRTGSTMWLLVWSVLLIVFGRVAVLLGRPPTVLGGTGR